MYVDGIELGLGGSLRIRYDGTQGLQELLSLCLATIHARLLGYDVVDDVELVGVVLVPIYRHNYFFKVH